MLAQRLEVAGGEYLFASINGGHIKDPRHFIAKVTEICGIKFFLHDLRRTFISVGESLDISPYALKALVNHKLPDRTDVTAGYIVHAHDIERLRRPMQKIEDYFLREGKVPKGRLIHFSTKMFDG